MDDQRFDHLTRALSRRLPRRDVTLLAGGAFGLFREQPVQSQTLGKRKCGRRRCKKVHVCFKRRCRPVPVAGKPCYTGLPCRNGAICVATGLAGDQVCVCPAGTSACGDFPETACVNLHTDPFHCGGCLNRCLARVTTCCSIGPLEPGECVNTDSDPRHCGGCGRTCGNGERCLGGECISQCRAGLSECGGVCVDTDTDPEHCGACGIACASGQLCVNGQCQGAACADDGEACQVSADCCLSPASVCDNGVCRNRCRPGFTYCGSCVALATDPANCGGCGQACQSGVACQGGVCIGGGAGGSCTPYGQACSVTSDCCNTVPCSGRICRFN